MDLALCLPYAPLPSVPPRFKYPNTSTATRVLTKPHFSFNPCSLSVPNDSILRQPLQTFGRHVVCARFSIPSKGDHHKGNDNVIVRGAVGASLVMTCVVAVMGCRAIAAPSKSLVMHHLVTSAKGVIYPDEKVISPFGAKGALESLFEVSVKIATSANTKEEYKFFRKRQPSKFDKVSKMPSIEEIADLKTEAVKLIKAGKSDEAEKQLQKVYENAKDKDMNYLNESAYFAQMALVEILMAQGKYSEASQCECLKIPEGGRFSDGRFYLYKRFNVAIGVVDWTIGLVTQLVNGKESLLFLSSEVSSYDCPFNAEAEALDWATEYAEKYA
ncbi:hypothetical protein FNV43_RR06015 [Rhamnella rubrinervis]|uniref:Uncharacterized protein n=1 Tax=Rhamnella rubrinervis TaxID=2594499 RepID=A0A8K0HCN8_9ROSA|nr:hypothetical protein FNV43_RR06015 [Rhamnella rubrinervis]